MLHFDHQFDRAMVLLRDESGVFVMLDCQRLIQSMIKVQHWRHRLIEISSSALPCGRGLIDIVWRVMLGCRGLIDIVWRVAPWVRLNVISQVAKKKAIVTIAHALIVIVWHVLATGKPYHELGPDYFTTRQDPATQTQRLAKLQVLGHIVAVEPAAA